MDQKILFLAGAYGIIWLVIGGYLLSIGSRLKKLERRNEEQ